MTKITQLDVMMALLEGTAAIDKLKRNLVTRDFGLTDDDDITTFITLGDIVTSYIAANEGDGKLFSTKEGLALTKPLDTFVKAAFGQGDFVIPEKLVHDNVTDETLAEHFGLTLKQAVVANKFITGLMGAVNSMSEAGTITEAQYEGIRGSFHAGVHKAFGGSDTRTVH